MAWLHRLEWNLKKSQTKTKPFAFKTQSDMQIQVVRFCCCFYFFFGCHPKSLEFAWGAFKVKLGQTPRTKPLTFRNEDMSMALTGTWLDSLHGWMCVSVCACVGTSSKSPLILISWILCGALVRIVRIVFCSAWFVVKGLFVSLMECRKRKILLRILHS